MIKRKLGIKDVFMQSNWEFYNFLCAYYPLNGRHHSRGGDTCDCRKKYKLQIHKVWRQQAERLILEELGNSASRI